MSRIMDRSRACALVAACLAAGLMLPQLAAGEEGQCPAQAAAGECPFEILSQVPYLQRLFQTVSGQTVSDDDAGARRIEVEFGIRADGSCPLGIKLCGKGCDGGYQAAACQATACKATACQAGGCQATACKAGACPASACECPALIAATKCCEAKCCDEKCCEVKFTAAKSCPKCGVACGCGANCACGKTAAAPHPELFAHILELTAHNAALQAQLEQQDDRDELIDELVELATENASLTAKLELSEVKAEVAQQMLRMSLENEHLKSQVHELARLLDQARDEVRIARGLERQPQR